MTLFKNKIKKNTNTIIINTATKKDSRKLSSLIRDRVKQADVQEEKFLDPTIYVFRTNNVSMVHVKNFFQDTYNPTRVYQESDIRPSQSDLLTTSTIIIPKAPDRQEDTGELGGAII